jgi:hypothetical protein
MSAALTAVEGVIGAVWMSITTTLILLGILIALTGAAIASWQRDTSVEQSWALFAAAHKLTAEEPLLGDARVFGTYRDHALEVRRWGTGHADFTTATVTIKRAMPDGLRVGNELFFHRLGTLAGLQDIQLGDEALDPALLIKGVDEGAIRALLTAEHVRGRLKELVALAEELSWEGQKISASARGHVSAGELEPLLDILYKLVDALEDETTVKER